MDYHFKHFKEEKHTCVKCNCHVDSKFAIEIDSRIFCKSCLAKFADSGRSDYVGSRRFINSVLLILFSSVPGANYMYMGLVKKGLSFLILFCSILALSGSFDTIMLTIPILYVYCFFDCFEKRRSINRGIEIPDDASELTHFFTKYKNPILYVFAFLMISDFLHNIISTILGRGNFMHMLTKGSSQILIVLIASFIFFYFIPLHKKKKDDEDFIDMTK